MILFMQVRACCLYWAAAPELQAVYLIFIEETLKTQAMFNEVIILAQNSSYTPKHKQVNT